VEEEALTSPDGADPPTSAGQIPALPPEISAKEQELRRLVDAGAASPEEIRALAAKLEEKRIYEESLWQREVRPALLQSKKRRLSMLDLRRDPERAAKQGSGSLAMGALLLAGVLLMLLIATQTSFLWLLVAVVGVLVYAWVQGRRHGAAADEPRAVTPPDAD
jgi:Flp pilus assembly protein TadB